MKIDRPGLAFMTLTLVIVFVGVFAAARLGHDHGAALGVLGFCVVGTFEFWAIRMSRRRRARLTRSN